MNKCVLLLTSLFVSTLAGCNLASAIHEEFTTFVATPTATVVNVTVVERTEEGVRLEMTVQLENPNDIPLPLTQASYTVQVNGLGSHRFVDQPQYTLPARGRQVLTLPAALARPGADPGGAAYGITGRVRFQTPGELRKIFTDMGIPLRSVRFASEGTLGAAADAGALAR